MRHGASSRSRPKPRLHPRTRRRRPETQIVIPVDDLAVTPSTCTVGELPDAIAHGHLVVGVDHGRPVLGSTVPEAIITSGTNFEAMVAEALNSNTKLNKIIELIGRALYRDGREAG